MARRDYYDWRGIAMLTQQLGQLFEPSKARLLSEQHEHEMNMLMAKKAWDTQTKQLEVLKKEYDGLLTNISTAETKLMERDLPELVEAATKDGAMGEESATILEKTSGKTLGDLNDTARKYEEMIRGQKSTLGNMVRFNAAALVGEKWTDDLLARPTEKREDVKGKDYKTLHDADKSGTLSWSEQNSALRDYIKDYYQPIEGEEGVQLMVGDEEVTASPEAHAFLAGFRHVRGRQKVDATEAAARASKLKTPEQYLNTMYQARDTIQGYEQKGMSKKKLALRKGSPYGDFTSIDVDIFSSSHDLFKEAYKAYTKKGGIIPNDLTGVKPVTELMFYNDPDAWVFDEPKEFTKEGLTPEVYEEIQSSTQPGSETLQKIAFNIVYNWEDIMKHGSDTEKNNMLKGFESLKKAYSF
jgi:hypothetical protein